MKMKTLLPSFMLFACTFQTIALNSETQNTIIKLEQSVISVGQLITQIENQTDYLVVFKSREVDIERYITVQNTSGKMISYLEEAFKDTDITYEFDNRYILLLKKNDKGRTSLIGQQSRTITGTVTDNNGEPDWCERDHKRDFYRNSHGYQWEIHLGSSTKSHLANFLHRLPDKRNRYR